MSRLIDNLNDLIALDFDAVNAYESAITRIDAEEVRDVLREYQEDHRRHIRDLSACVSQLGGTPRDKPDAKGFFIQAFTAITSMMGDRAALSAMRSNEELTNKAYDRALAECVWPTSMLQIIERNREDERRHLAYVLQTIDAMAVARADAHR
jgi:uncharacterized protein (TIGR02284 family)